MLGSAGLGGDIAIPVPGVGCAAGMGALYVTEEAMGLALQGTVVPALAATSAGTAATVARLLQNAGYSRSLQAAAAGQAARLPGLAFEAATFGRVLRTSRGGVVRGAIVWQEENAAMSQLARQYNDSAHGARSRVLTRSGLAPTLRYRDASGKNKAVRFDGYDGVKLIDRKLSVVTTEKAKSQAVRQSESLLQNGMKAVWEVPRQSQKIRAERMFEELGIKNIEVRIVNLG